VSGPGEAVGGGRLAILAAGGAVPVHVAEAAVAAGRPVFIVGLDRLADERLRAFPHEMVKWGQIGRIVELLAAHQTEEVVLIGAVDQRPNLRDLRFDFGGLRLLPRIAALLVGGDNSVMGGLVKLFEERGYRVRGAHEIAPDLVAGPGLIGGPRPSPAELADAQLAAKGARLIGTLDSGQAAVVVQSRVIALEGAEGTDAMVRRVADLRAAKRVNWSGRSGVLAKCCKPQQDIRVDMPAIGPQTVRAVAEAGLAGIAIEPFRVMIVDRSQTIAAARDTSTFIIAGDETDEPADANPPRR
jgi:DUF1009 family protein